MFRFAHNEQRYTARDKDGEMKDDIATGQPLKHSRVQAIDKPMEYRYCSHNSDSMALSRKVREI